MFAYLLAGSLFLVLVLTRLYAAKLYDIVIVKMTARWYAAVLDRLPHGAHLFDIGIGTATALAHNSDLVRAKRLQVVGIDYDASYIKHAEGIVASYGLNK